jgi:hypothetical protein
MSFGKSTRWSERLGKSTSGTESWFVGTFNNWCRTPGYQLTLLQLLDEEAGRSQASSPDKPWHHYPEASCVPRERPMGASVSRVVQDGG